MYQNGTVAFSKWARSHRAFFAVLLSIVLMFSTTHVFAAAGFKHVSQVNAMAASHMDKMHVSSHSGHSDSDCCKGAHCTCMAHCSQVWLSQRFLLLHSNWHQSALIFLAENTPASYINSPPQRPPRA